MPQARGSPVGGATCLGSRLQWQGCRWLLTLRAGSPRAATAGFEFVKEASKRGMFAHMSDFDVQEWRSATDIVQRRFAECHDL
jgi:hypothetical protein